MRDRIDSLVIEGHTDDRGSDIYNLKLSQERSLNVMVKGLEVIKDSAPWAYRCFHEKTSASGRGRQDLVLDQSRGLDREKSRRVVFKIRLRSTDQLVEAGTVHDPSTPRRSVPACSSERGPLSVPRAAKSHIVSPGVWCVACAIRRSYRRGVIVPGASPASSGAGRPKGRSDYHAGEPVIRGIVPVSDPFPEIARQVVDAVGSLAERQLSDGTQGVIPSPLGLPCVRMPFGRVRVAPG